MITSLAIIGSLLLAALAYFVLAFALVKDEP